MPFNSGVSASPYSGGYSSTYSNYTPTYNSYDSYSALRPNTIYSGGSIKIVCPREYEDSVHYRLNSWDFTIQPGQSQRFTDDRSWTIRFDRGGSYGAAQYQLNAGTYRFRVNSRGWELYKSG